MRQLQLGNVGEGDDDALDPVVLRAVGQDAPQIPCPSVAFDLAAEGLGIRQHRRSIDEEILVVGTAGEIGERPSDVGRDDAEMRSHRRREEPDVQLAVQEDRRDLGAVEDILQIVGGDALLLDGFVQLAVEGGQLLIERLKLFLRGFQLLIGGLEFLVHRQGFFVDRLLLFVGEFEVADGALELLPRRVELAFDLRELRGFGFCHGSGPARPFWLIDEADEEHIPGVALDRPDVDTDRDGAPLPAQLHPRHEDARMVAPGLQDRRPELVAQPLARHREDVRVRRRRRELSNSCRWVRNNRAPRNCR